MKRHFTIPSLPPRTACGLARVDMLVDRAMEDDRFRQQLFLKAAKKTAKGVDLDSYRTAIDEATDTGGFVDYHEAFGFAQGIDDAVDVIEELLSEGHASEAMDLAEHALERVEEAILSMDDSDGNMSMILDRLQGIHLKACQKARPDPEALARRLFEWELRTEWDTFHRAAHTYAGILGEKGLAVYRRLAEKEWAKVPKLEPGTKLSERFDKNFRITHIMETLARETGDVDAVVAVKSRDLSTAYDFLQIAEAYKTARKYDQALDWAERGVQAFPERTDSRLREFLAAEYHRRKRHDDAMNLIWANFTDQPGLEPTRA